MIPRRQSQALLVGDYAHADAPPLDFSVADAEDIAHALRTLTEITLLCAERPKPQKTGSAWMHLATLYRSRF